MKASVAGQGVVAAILENNGESWIKYYNTDGTEIASSHPNMDSPGYPMDLSLSADGLWMAVSYAYEDGGKMKSQVAFYNFGSRGEDLVDNLASSSSYTDMLCPQMKPREHPHGLPSLTTASAFMKEQTSRRKR